jgi:type II secretory ATPase GspE/PulE/Tfp pilus assembly ATPase PilB-like protein
LLTLAEQALILMSIYKPLLGLALFLPWAWIVSRVYDKHAARFFLPREMWNIIHISAGLLAFVALLGFGFVLPGSEAGFWAGFGVALVILIADLYAYMHVANRDDRVPERYHIKLKMEKPDDADKKKAAAGAAKVRFAIKAADEKGKFSKLLPAPAAETPEAEIRVAGEKLLGDAMAARASQVELVPAGKDNLYQVRTLVDGVFVTGESIPGPNAAKLIDFWKTAAGLDLADRRRKQQRLISVEDGGMKRVVRITSIGAQGGQRLTALFDPESSVLKKADTLGLLEPQMDELRKIVADAKGVVLVTAPRDGGRTTLLYSLLQMHDAYTSNVQTVETDQQASLEGVRHNVFDSTADASVPASVAGAGGASGPEFATLVRSILRRDPQVVGVSELPDQNTAKEISKADHDRCRTYVSFPGGDALVSVQQWVKSVGDPKAAGECVHGIVAGRLLRKLCTNCRVAYQPAPEMLKKFGIPEGKVQQLFKKGGQVLIKNRTEVCPVCQGVGYVGQEGIFEVALITPEERALIAQGNLPAVKAALRKRQVPTLQQAAIRKAVDGVTSIEEVVRVTSTDKPAEPAKPGAPAGPPATTPG